MKKKKEVCPFCGNSFAYLSRHKCKVKERVEGPEESEKSDAERRLERIEERKREGVRGLKKDEQMVFKQIMQLKDIYFDDLLEITNKEPIELDKILDTLALQSKIKVTRELVVASWTKHISIMETFDIKVKDRKIDKKKNDFILDMFSHQPCLICPFASKCNNTNLDQFNPKHCPWLSDWIKLSLEGIPYDINFEGANE
ncbi:MAG: hypothetical protein HWN80_08595 [Candidatus Lokiarchaeota archaeon]|nr:hypothetical protein [Candidatus Lokiarchaeota archaeon]